MRCEPCSGLLWRSDQAPASQAGGTLATLQSTQLTVTEVPVRALHERTPLNAALYRIVLTRMSSFGMGRLHPRPKHI